MAHAEHDALGGQVYTCLRSAILEGRLKIGERLKQEELALRMNVSRMPVRSALARLEQEGLVTVIPHKGAWVTYFNEEQIIEIYLLRKTLEKKAVETAVKNIDPEHISTLTRLNNYFEKLASSKHYQELIKTNEKFHFALYERCGFPYLLEIIRDLWKRFPRYTFNLISGQGKQSSQEHWDIVEAVAKGEPEKAGQLMYLHIEHAQQALIKEMKARLEGSRL